MADPVTFNATKDRIGALVLDAQGSGADILVVLLQSAGLQADGVMRDHATLGSLLAANAEATFTNYVRKTLASPTRTVDNTLDRVLLGGAPVGTPLALLYTSAGGTTNNTLAKAVFVYAPTAAADSAILPLMAIPISAATDGNNITLTLHTDGFARVL